MATLTQKQAAFVEHYMACKSGEQAALRAGYSPSTARKQGYQMLRHPVMAFCIREKEAAVHEDLAINPEFVLNKIITTIARCEQQPRPDNNAILRGCELLARTMGMLRDKHEISGADGGPIETKEVAEAAESFLFAIDNLAKRAE